MRKATLSKVPHGQVMEMIGNVNMILDLSVKIKGEQRFLHTKRSLICTALRNQYPRSTMGVLELPVKNLESMGSL
jgi:hypothetical protein